jgi:hypothetical protein
MHITKKAFLAILACFVIILTGYFFYGANYRQGIFQTIQRKPLPVTTAPSVGTSVTPTIPVTTKESLPLAIGETGTFGTLTLKVNSLKGDSRCPVDVQCIRAGDVTVSVTLTDFGSSTIALTDVTPAKKSKEEIKDTDYSFTFVVIHTQ